MHNELRGLYAITDSQLLSDNALVASVEQAIRGGAQVIQYRDKSHDATKRLQQAQALQTLCRGYRIPLIINDDVALAQAIAADGVHLGKTDGSVTVARQQLGATTLIGVSCYNQLALAEQAVAAGADYIAFGSFFPSMIKPDAVTADIPLLRHAKQTLPCPVVAIGGITVNNGADLFAAGADCLAVISGVFGADDIQAAAQQYTALFA